MSKSKPAACTLKDELMSSVRNGERCEGWGMALEDDIGAALESGKITRDEADELLQALDVYATHPLYA
jgi:hypothetical protein